MNVSTKAAAKRDVLIIDDDPNITEIIETFCERLGCFRNIIIANDGLAANTKMMNQAFSIIFLDLTMPKKGGMDLVKEINKYKRDRSFPNKIDNIIIISGNLHMDIIKELMSLGVRHFLAKPFKEDAFQKKTLEVLTKGKVKT